MTHHSQYEGNSTTLSHGGIIVASGVEEILLLDIEDRVMSYGGCNHCIYCAENATNKFQKS
jgi:hypothetical protein